MFAGVYVVSQNPHSTRNVYFRITGYCFDDTIAEVSIVSLFLKVESFLFDRYTSFPHTASHQNFFILISITSVPCRPPAAATLSCDRPKSDLHCHRVAGNGGRSISMSAPGAPVGRQPVPTMQTFELGAPADSMRQIDVSLAGDPRERVESPTPTSDTPLSTAGAWGAAATPQKSRGPMSGQALRESALLRESQLLRESSAAGSAGSTGGLRDSSVTAKTGSSSRSHWYRLGWNDVSSPVRDRLSKSPLEIAREFFNAQIAATPRSGKGRAHQCPTTQMQVTQRKGAVVYVCLRVRAFPLLC